MSGVKTPYAVKMTRKSEGKVELLVVSTTLHKSNENLQALIKLGFELSDTLSRSKGGLSYGGKAQFSLYVVGTDAQAKVLDPNVYGALLSQEKPQAATAKEEPKEEPVQQAEVPETDAGAYVGDVPEERTTARKTRVATKK